MSPVRFETDQGGFGRVRFPRPKGCSRLPLEPLQAALEATLHVRFETRRERLFGPPVLSFVYMGERVKLRMLDTGDAQIDLSAADDEMRETLIEHLRQSDDFEQI
ncbi:hypothetical protein [Asticcacaulis sp. EMRT-3]|uniref:hypothetical protein n=1 Tax=Asticcacaulis sp. EMRT-3 TaxID=3040349 RepID=UPI0024AF4255|nr:hypothetical protein [Asticcacaulis sp. EMRT-3]MDI7774019.1 hypothetical protein [Asticcacaulis sp. EMRT-3]